MSSSPSVAGMLEPFAYGRGYLERLVIADPGAGLPVIVRMGSGLIARPLAFGCQLVTSATAANRWAELRIADSDAAVWERFGAGVLIPASTTVQLAWSDARGESEWASAGADLTPIFMPMPARFLQPTDQLRLVIGNMQAADAITAARLTVERFPEQRGSYESGGVDLPPARVR